MKPCPTTDWSGVIILGMFLASMLLWAVIRRWRTPPEDIIYEQKRDNE